MADDRNQLARQEFLDDFRLAVYQLVQFIENEHGAGLHRIRPDVREWRLQRVKTIEKLKELIDMLDKICVAAHYGKGCGIGTEIAGHITSIISSVMKLKESSSAQTFMSIGKFLTHSGSLLEGASSVAESLISAKYLKEVVEVLKKDQELSRPLQDWLTFSRNLDANIRRIFGCDLDFAIQNNVLKVFSEFATLRRRCRSFSEIIDMMRNGNYSLDIGVNVPIDSLLRFSSQLDTYPELYDNIHTICCSLSDPSRVAQVAMEGVQVYRNFFGEELNSGTDGNRRSEKDMADSAIPGYSNGLENDREAAGSSRLRIQRDRDLPSVRAVSTFCAFQTIDIALNFVHLSKVIITIKDGKSKYSHALQQISDLLTMELRSMEAL